MRCGLTSYSLRHLSQEMSVRVPSISASSRYPVQQMAMATSYMCRYCAKQFTSVRDMQLHVLQHSRGNAPLNCAICNKSYRTPSKLQRHVRVHSGERPYICNLCGRRFTRSDHLKQHMKVHSPNRQKNMCRLCNARFTSCHLLATHLRTHEIHQIHLCRCCGEGFPTSDELDRHKRLHDVKGNIRATRGRRGTLHPMSADPRLDIVNPKSGSSLHSEQVTLNEKPNLHGSKWIGCARFCLSQIPPESSNNNNSSKDDNDDNLTSNDNNNSKNNDSTEIEALKSIFGSKSLNDNDRDDHDSNDKPSRRVEMKLSPGHDQEQQINVNDDSRSFEVEIIAEDLSKERGDTGKIENKKLDCNNRPKMEVSSLSHQPDPAMMTSLSKGSRKNRLHVSDYFNMSLLPSVSCDDNYQPAVTGSNIPCPPPFKRSSDSLKALIKRESKGLGLHNMTYTRNLLGVPSSFTRPFYMTSHLDPRLQFSPYPISTAYLDLMYHSNTSNKSDINITTKQQQLSDMSSGTRCEHCHIWFEDSAMFMLHNSLHSADDADPFTCKKCMKKMGNRLEFTAHLVWHLDPVIG
ncbi:MDS1 and EVI1 complex locus protein EVI1-A isoform X1 [Octopus sinensis]|uniref:MDS1 and EVI1 complex locus protein EVI1-A isoform X1 n=2 Tax=Octopus sinensis TaxID=2607531 RepID=A0A6P7T5A4_9MOLL|nr:MDS1 and EVI1 complex locus protein EVI1-A isoform X1 [Octopus sinensis]XP_036364790.1 MDS1 and EVI1 complex locus protein EVI1-A isoform X1 [Octopus sinensis]